MGVSRTLLQDLDALNLDVHMLTTWREHDSVDTLFQQCPVRSFRYSKLAFPGRDPQDELGAIPAAWKVSELRRTMRAAPRPFS
ncbi:hypothetical protein LC082_06280 [Microbacterium esteraromaticum]|uniref:hypothetical protein n=1 Tax=Microbacterium esteraromaticum TaxID=57043 RepID=UPI001CD7B9C7|nr:hypothetical protein [Microbacterium esteraromaticum]MCA1306502.1 hypothetical protein [Microbacterium esteraromaticum]